jgi:Spy/CpxP family protein refolding chaperone
MRLFAVLCIAGAAFAQGQNRPPNSPMPPRPAGPQRMQPGMPAMPGPAPQFDQMQDLRGLKTYLDLTDAQVEQIRRVRDEARRQADEKVRVLEPQIREKRAALADLFAKNTTDATAVGRLMLDIRALEKQVREAHEAVRTSELKVLTPEQRTRLRAVEEAAALPQATREAIGLGLVEGPAPGQGGQPRPRQMMRPGMRMQNQPQPPPPPRAPNPGEPPRD